MCTSSNQADPQNAAGALAMMDTALDYLTGADLHALGTAGQGEALTALARITARTSAVQAAVLAVFDAAGGPEEAGCGTVSTWLVRNTQATKGSAGTQRRWSRTQQAHPAVAEAMSSGDLSEPYGQLICGWTRKLPDEMQAQSDKILVEAALGGCGVRELRLIMNQIWEQHKQNQPDEDGNDPFEDRWLRLESTLDGAGRVRGDLTPQCTASLQAVLDALGKKNGPEDTRTHGQRQHDALAEALAILLRSKTLPDRAGTDTTCLVNTPFSQLRRLPGASVIEDAWLHAAPGEPVFLTGKDAEAAACDATLIPVVSGYPDWVVVDQIIEVTLTWMHATARSLSAEEWAGLQLAIAKLALEFCSGPHGPAAALRAALANGGTPQTPVSYPLDIGYSQTVPGWMRRAVINRDRHCAWPGGCDQPPARCHVHHLTPKNAGGSTSLANCLLLCALCRRRHNAQYADLGIMPVPGFPALVAGVRVLWGPA
jgi:Domain of unknown function (DUF222)/HNH endonuclease